MLVDDAVVLRGLRGDVRVEAGRDGKEDLGEDDEFLARELEFFDRFSEHHFGAPIRVHLEKAFMRDICLGTVWETHIRGIEGLDAVVISTLNINHQEQNDR